MADIFDVIADATRRDLLQALLHSGSGELSVGQLVEKLGLSQPTVSKHLRVLRDSNLVVVREMGQHRYYRVEAAPLGSVGEWLHPFFGGELEVENERSGIASSGGSRVEARGVTSESLTQVAAVGRSMGRHVANASFQVRARLSTPISWALGR